MNLLDIVQRNPEPVPWAEGEKIPWNEPDFSRRMLAEHLSQTHDAASRRLVIVERHVTWIHEHLLEGVPSRLLDLGCGPGLYTSRLARLGHRCVGIDFSPASIAHATAHAADSGLDVAYFQEDIRTAAYGEGYDLVMLVFGEFNLFHPGDAKRILQKARRALRPGGLLLLEPHPFETVRRIGQQPASWYAVRAGLFSDEPHLCLQENLWNADACVAIERYYIIAAETGEVTRHSASVQAYTEAQYRALLRACGFGEITFLPSLSGDTSETMGDLVVLLASASS